MTISLQGEQIRNFLVPANPPLDDAVAPNFQRFDGVDGPGDNYDAHPTPLGWLNYEGKGTGPKPGSGGSPEEDIVYTPGPHYGITNVLGGQPYPAADWQPDGSVTPDLNRGFTPGKTYRSPQFWLGKLGYGGQNNNGVEQTLMFSELNNNPPVPGDLATIMSGW
jgi:hypothetical protein